VKPEGYSLCIDFSDCPADLHTFPWTCKPGYHAEVTIYDLQLQDMKDLASAIMAEAIKIELEQAK